MCNIRFERRVVFIKKFRQSVSDAAPSWATQCDKIIQGILQKHIVRQINAFKIAQLL